MTMGTSGSQVHRACAMNVKGHHARDLCSDNVVIVGAEERVSDVPEKLAALDATHCAVFDGGRRFIGIARLREAAAKPAERIFADLLVQPPPLDVQETTEASLVMSLMDARGSQELVVLSSKRQYVGLITRFSLLAWRMAQR